jgi:hypothetical protein
MRTMPKLHRAEMFEIQPELLNSKRARPSADDFEGWLDQTTRSPCAGHIIPLYRQNEVFGRGDAAERRPGGRSLGGRPGAHRAGVEPDADDCTLSGR